MWPFTKKTSKKLYKIVYSIACIPHNNVVTISVDNFREKFVQADSELDAQKKFASEIMLSSGVYIHTIDKVLEIDII